MLQIKEFINKNKVLSKIAYNILYSKEAQKQYRENKAILNRNEEYHDIFKGKRCFVIGTGPSLSINDLELLSGEITFAPNRIFELFDKTTWRPTYYINQDHALIQSYTNAIKTIDCQSIFLPIEYVDVFQEEKFHFFVLQYKDFYPGFPDFSKDLTQRLAQGFTVTYGAIQLAAYMGFSEIYLLGVDHNYSIIRDANGKPLKTNSGSTNYANGMENKMDISNLPRIEETTLSFEFAERYSRRHGFRIFNATRGGKLEAFERVDFDKIIR